MFDKSIIKVIRILTILNQQPMRNEMNTSKRNLAKVLGVSGVGALVWKKPIVESVVLPSHAQISCNAPAGCYGIDGGALAWPGGFGPETVRRDGCEATTGPSWTLVVASNSTDAFNLLGCDESLDTAVVPTTPALVGCSFYRCVVST